jgi:serine/threonine-protein kinase RsbW
MAARRILTEAAAWFSSAGAGVGIDSCDNRDHEERVSVRSREEISDPNVRDMTAGDTVLLTVPLKPEYVQLVRLAVAGLGAHAELGREVTDDVKLAVSEACACLLRVVENQRDGEAEAGEAEAGTTLTVRFDLCADGWEIKVSAESLTTTCALDTSELSPLSEEALRVKVMQALMDEVESIAEDRGVRFLRLRKALS